MLERVSVLVQNFYSKIKFKTCGYSRYLPLLCNFGASGLLHLVRVSVVSRTFPLKWKHTFYGSVHVEMQYVCCFLHPFFLSTVRAFDW